jgi:hypothetical protein
LFSGFGHISYGNIGIAQVQASVGVIWFDLERFGIVCDGLRVVADFAKVEAEVEPRGRIIWSNTNSRTVMLNCFPDPPLSCKQAPLFSASLSVDTQSFRDIAIASGILLARAKPTTDARMRNMLSL